MSCLWRKAGQKRSGKTEIAMENKVKTDQIGIIGAGELGQALGHVLEKAGAQVLYYDREDDRTTTASIGNVVVACNLLLICVPSWANREVAKDISKHIDPQNPPLVISLSKGVEKGFVTIDQVLAETLPHGTPYGLIYGPMLANELVAHQMGSGVLALSEIEYGNTVRDIFAKARVYLELSSDMRGTAISGVLRSVYAIAFGMCDGLKLGANARGRLSVMVLREMKRILSGLGANPDTAESLAGLGDLLAAGTGEASFNYRVGRSIAERIADSTIHSEGLSTLQEISHVLKLSDYPLISLLDKLIYHYGDPHEFQQLLEI
jgi:glycerol-3-phosphate dehydrogenase (NAD(P)+)